MGVPGCLEQRDRFRHSRLRRRAGNPADSARGDEMDAQREAENTGISLVDVVMWIGYAAFIVFIGVPLFGVALGIVVFVGGAVLSLIFALLPFVIGLAVIAGAIWVFTSG
jgi:uncharacterized membrane protein (DUF485 family)